MAFSERRLGDIIVARNEASKVLIQEGCRKRSISFDEALVLQAISHILLSAPAIYGYDLMKLLGMGASSVYPILNRFENRLGLLQVAPGEDLTDRKRNGAPRKLYQPTDPLGKKVISLFQTE